MESYFIRHTKALRVRDEDMKALWDDDRIAIHYPDPKGFLGDQDSESIEPEHYDGSAKTAIKYFRNLEECGGYVWAESFACPGRAKIGVIEQGTKIQQWHNARWDLRGQPSDFPNRRDGDPAILKTLKLSRPKLVSRREQVGLRAGRPRQGTIARWGGQRLVELVDGRLSPRAWGNLSTAQQEAACAEFLRLQTSHEWLPQLSFLLLPVGGTLQDIDIYGLATDGREIFAQVTYHLGTRKEARQKAKVLASYGANGAHLIFFGRGERPERTEDLTYVDAQNLVMNWMREESEYETVMFET